MSPCIASELEDEKGYLAKGDRGFRRGARAGAGVGNPGLRDYRRDYAGDVRDCLVLRSTAECHDGQDLTCWKGEEGVLETCLFLNQVG